jgi:hypothetical protein
MPTEKKTQPSCPCSRDLNWTGKGLTSGHRYEEGGFEHNTGFTKFDVFFIFIIVHYS